MFYATCPLIHDPDDPNITEKAFRYTKTPSRNNSASSIKNKGINHHCGHSQHLVVMKPSSQLRKMDLLIIQLMVIKVVLTVNIMVMVNKKVMAEAEYKILMVKLGIQLMSQVEYIL